MSGSCVVVPVILVLILTVTGTQAQCTQQELYTLYQCILPYNTKFMLTFGTGGSCDRALISEDVCTDFTDIVVCANQKDISSTCRQYALGQIDQSMEIPCKIRDFEEVCKKAPAIDKGGCARASGISLGLLGVVIIVSLIAHM